MTVAKNQLKQIILEKTIDDTVAMASLTRDKEGEVFGAETADLEREGEKHEPAGEATYTRDKTYVETKPAKAPEELFETDASDVERGPDPGGGQVSQYLVEEELTASNGEGGPDPGDRGQVSQHLLEEQVTVSDVARGPDTGRTVFTISGGGGTHGI